MAASEASSSKALIGPKSALFLVTWLTVQLIGSILMVTLVGFHYGQTRSTLCLTTHNSSQNNAVNGSSSAGACESNQVALTFAVIACIITVIDATINMDYLIHRVKDEKLPSRCSCNCNCCFNNYYCCNYCCNCCCNCCFNCCFNCCGFDYLPMGIVRVCYCWVLIHILLITIAGNTYEWSWQTDDLDVLTNTAIFFFACFMYLVICVAIFIWQYTILRTSVRTKLEKINQLQSLSEDQSEIKRHRQNDYCILLHCFTSALFLLHIIVTIATLVAFFDNSRSDDDGLSHNRVVIAAGVILYVCFSSLFWFLAIVLYIVNVLEMYDTTKLYTCFRNASIIIIVTILFVSTFFFIVGRATLLNSIVNPLFLSLLGFSLLVWLISVCLHFFFCTYLLQLCRLPQARKPASSHPV